MRDENGRFINGDRALRELERRLNGLEGRFEDRTRSGDQMLQRFLVAEERVAGLREDIGEIKADLKSSRALIRSVLITAAVSVVGQVVVFAVTRGG